VKVITHKANRAVIYGAIAVCIEVGGKECAGKAKAQA
jgi:hypothetical protein